MTAPTLFPADPSATDIEWMRAKVRERGFRDATDLQLTVLWTAADRDRRMAVEAFCWVADGHGGQPYEPLRRRVERRL